MKQNTAVDTNTCSALRKYATRLPMGTTIKMNCKGITDRTSKKKRAVA